MIQKQAIRVGKFLLFLGVSLSGLAAVETHREMVEALELHEEPTVAIAPQQSPPNLPPQSLPQNTPAESSAPTTSPSPQASSPQAASEGRSQLAINTQSVTPEQAQVQIAQVDPSQIAANEWLGASFPLENFQTYTSPFGYRPSPMGGYSQEFHYGLDLAAPEGSYIRNWWTGIVVEVSDDSNCGTSVVVESGSWTHIYCHMQGHVETNSQGRYMIDRSGGIQIWEGQEVVAGTRIGRVGMTGRTTGPHLHWGLKFDGNWVDPGLVLRAMYTQQRQLVSNQSQ